MFWFSGCKTWVLSSLTRDGTLEGEILTTGLPGKSWSLSFENVRHADVVHIEFSLFIYKITKQVVLTGLNPHSPGLYISLPMSFWEIGSWGFKSKMKKDWCSLTLMAHSFLLSWFGGSTIVPDFLKTRTTWLRMMFTESLFSGPCRSRVGSTADLWKFLKDAFVPVVKGHSRQKFQVE